MEEATLGLRIILCKYKLEFYIDTDYPLDTSEFNLVIQVMKK
jgi:hypothetical protein